MPLPGRAIRTSGTLAQPVPRNECPGSAQLPTGFSGRREDDSLRPVLLSDRGLATTSPCSLPLPSSCTTTRACASHACDPSSRPGQSRPRAPTYRFSRRLSAQPLTRKRWNRRWATAAGLGILTTLRGKPMEHLEHLEAARLARKPSRSHAFRRSQTLWPPSATRTRSVLTCDGRLDGGTGTASTRRSNRPGSLVARRRRRRPLGACDAMRRHLLTT
jgi:hypothetical protein